MQRALRRAASPYKDDLQKESHAATIKRLKVRLMAEGWDFSVARTKILMLAHNAIAARQGYPTITDRDAFVKKEDPLIPA